MYVIRKRRNYEHRCSDGEILFRGHYFLYLMADKFRRANIGRPCGWSRKFAFGRGFRTRADAEAYRARINGNERHIPMTAEIVEAGVAMNDERIG